MFENCSVVRSSRLSPVPVFVYSLRSSMYMRCLIWSLVFNALESEGYAEQQYTLKYSSLYCYVVRAAWFPLMVNLVCHFAMSVSSRFIICASTSVLAVGCFSSLTQLVYLVWFLWFSHFAPRTIWLFRGLKGIVVFSSLVYFHLSFYLGCTYFQFVFHVVHYFGRVLVVVVFLVAQYWRSFIYYFSGRRFLADKLGYYSSEVIYFLI